MAGSKNVIELHGSIHRNICTKCGRQYNLEDILKMDSTPKCPKCGGQLIHRNGKYGIFIGCSNYPKCKYIRK